MQRYMIVYHPEHNATLCIEGNRVLGQQPVHDHCQEYHWLRLDEDHILMTCNFAMNKHNYLHNHEKVSVLPSIGSVRSLHAHTLRNVPHKYKRKHLQSVQKKFNLDNKNTIEDLIDVVVKQHGPLFAPKQ